MTNDAQESQDTALVAVIPAGGVGTRLWPLSRPDRPKFLLDLLGTGRTLLQATADRLAPVAAETVVVTGAAHADAVRAQLPQVPAANVIAEPSPRDSMAAIALAAAVIEARRGPAVMGSFAADQVIEAEAAFHDAVAVAARVAATGKVVTIGITPTEPSTAFGYIHRGAALGDEGLAFEVVEFTEKPDAATAESMLATGEYLWNAGIFVTRTDVLLGHLGRLHPSLHAGVREIAAAVDTPAEAEAFERVWPTLTKIAIDHAIAEPVAADGGVAVVPGDLGWADVGDFAALSDMLPEDDGVTAVGRDARVIAVDAESPLVVGGTKPVAIVGLDNVAVIETDEAILVVARDSAQAVKRAAEAAATES